jgi:RNA polymerase sigma-70 factor (ECF subfamily)
MRTQDNAERQGQAAHGRDPTQLTIFEQYRGLLFSIAYRMLGSVADAEDMLQETFMRWQAAENIRSPKAFLVTVISRLCINHLQSARVQREEYVGEWLPEPLLTDPRTDPASSLKIDESLSVAFLVLLERLNPIERAVFLLHEVFDYKHAEIAETLEQSEANCRQILRRAQKRIGVERQRFKASAQEHNDLVERFVRATRSGDMDGLIALLSRDVVLHSDGGGKGIALLNRIRGEERVARSLLRGLQKRVPKNLVGRVAQINGERGLVGYLDGKLFSVLSFHVSDGRIQAIYVVTNPEKLSHLPGLAAYTKA